MLFTPNLSAVLFVPANKEGTAHLPDTLETVPAKVLSHSTQLSSLVIGKGCVSFTTKEGILYSKDEKTLIACPAGIATAVVIPECVEVIGPQAFLGCEITSIVSQGRLTSLADSAFSDTTKQTAVVALASTDTYEEQKALWLAAGFTHFNEPAKPGAIQKPDATHSGFVFELLDDYTLSVSWQGSDDPDVNLEIPSSAMIDGVSYRVSHVAEGAFQNRSSLESVSIPAGVTTVGNAAFEGCTALVSVDLPEGLTSIGDYVFEKTVLSEVVLPGSLSLIGEYAFSDCVTLARIVVLSESVSVAESALSGCSGVSILVPYREDGEYPWVVGLPAAGNSIKPYGVALLADPLVMREGEIADFCEGGVLEVPEECDVSYSYSAASVSINSKGIVTTKAAGVTEISLTLSLGETVLSNASRTVVVEAIQAQEKPFTEGNNGSEAFPTTMPLTAVSLSATGDSIVPLASGVGSIVTHTTKNGVVVSFYVSAVSGSTGEVWVGKNFASESVWNGTQLAISTEVTVPVEIPDKFVSGGITWTVVGVCAHAFAFCKVPSVIFGDSVVTMKRGVFSSCPNLTSVVLGKSTVNIASYVFYICPSLKNIYVRGTGVTSSDSSAASTATVYLPPGASASPWSSYSKVTAYTVLMNYGGSTLTSWLVAASPSFKLTAPPDPTVPPDDLPDATFSGWYPTADFSGPAWDFSSSVAQSMTLYARWVSSLEDGDLVYKRTSTNGLSVSIKESARTSAVSISIPATHSFFGPELPVIEIGQQGFKGCIKLESITIGSNVTKIEPSAFEGSLKLSVVVLPEDSALLSIGAKAFSDCVLLKVISFPDSLKTVGDSAFEQSGLDSLVVPSSVSSLGNSAFSQCKNLGSVSFAAPSNLSSLGTAVFYASGVTSIELPEGMTTVGNQTFENCVSLASVKLPSTMKTVGDSAFAQSGLASLVIPASVSSLGNSAFSQCKNLGSVSFMAPSSLSALGAGAFYASGVTSVELPEGMTAVGDQAFENCVSLVSAKLPSTMKSIGKTSFRGCTALRGFDGEGSALETVGGSAFEGCSVLKELVLPATLSSIGPSAFADCSKLTSFVAPVSLKAIEESAFARSGLVSIVLAPAGALTIATGAFSLCGSLKTAEFIPSASGSFSVLSSAFTDSVNLSFLKVGTNANNVSFALGAFDGCLAPSLGSIIVCEGTATDGLLVKGAFDGSVQRNVPVALTSNTSANQQAWKTAGFVNFGLAQSHILSFDLGFVGAMNAPADQILYESQKATKPKDPYRAGYSFVGWFAEGSSVPWDFTVDCMGMTDIKLIAQWQQGDDPQPISVDVSLTDAIALDAQGKTMKEAPLKFTSQTADSSIYLASIACTLSQDASNPVFGNSAKGVTLSARSVAGPESGTGALAGCILSFGPSTLPSFVMTTQNATAEALLSLGLDESSIVNYGPEARSVATLVCTFGRG